jgi:hypothetical protein
MPFSLTLFQTLLLYWCFLTIIHLFVLALAWPLSVLWLFFLLFSPSPQYAGSFNPMTCLSKLCGYVAGADLGGLWWWRRCFGLPWVLWFGFYSTVACFSESCIAVLVGVLVGGISRAAVIFPQFMLVICKYIFNQFFWISSNLTISVCPWHGLLGFVISFTQFDSPLGFDMIFFWLNLTCLLCNIRMSPIVWVTIVYW